MFICAGHINWDIRLRVDRLPAVDEERRIKRRYESGGGSAANVAIGLTELGNESHLLGAVGDDERGEKAVSRLETAGVETHVRVTDRETTEKYILLDDVGDVALLGTDGANECFEVADLPAAALDSASALHLTAQPPETAAKLTERVPEDAVISFDPGRRVGERGYEDALERVDLLFVTEAEAQSIAVDVPGTVIKRGADGAVWRGPEGTIESVGLDIGTPVDTTGAGDAFAAGFLSVWVETRDTTRALAVGNACGALAARQEGPDANLSWGQIGEIIDDPTDF
jgi:ribokinase